MTDQIKILLVDDEEAPREILSFALQDRGYRTLQARDGVEALGILHQEKTDVVISDILMPRMDGYRLCYEMRKDEQLKSIPFIIYTGTYITPADEKLGMEFGANMYLKKSGSVDDVVDAVQEVLRQIGKPAQRESLDELDVMKEYSERLVGKLEEKNIELEQAKDELLRKNEELERMAEALRTDISERKKAEEQLRQSEERFAKAFHANPALISLSYLKDGTVIDVNESFLRTLGYRREEVIGRRSLDLGLWIEEDGEKVLKVLVEGRRLHNHETRLRTKSMEERIVLASAEVIELRGKECILAMSYDITERKRTEEALKQAEEKYRSIFQNAVEGIYQSTREGRYINVNPALARIFGYDSPEEFVREVQDIGKQIYVNPIRRIEFIRLVEGQGELGDFEYEALKKDGTKIWVSSNARAIRGSDGNIHHYEGTIMDVTNRKQAEEKLKELTRKVIETQEQERKRIARELHDSIGQMLSAVKFRIQSAGEKIASQKSRIWKDLSDAWTLLEQSIHEVRRVSHNLRPSILDDLGLVSAVRNMCEEFTERTHIKVILKSSRFPRRLLPEVELSVFRIIQEALNNVEQHSRATQLALQIQKKNSHLMVSIKDNGKGFDPHAAYKQRSRARGFGLDGIRERVSTLGGHLDVQTAMNEGVQILIKIPLQQETRHRAN